MKPCAIADCDRQAKARGLCKLHYDLCLRSGTLKAKFPTPAEILNRRVRSDSLRKSGLTDERAADLASLIRLLP